MSESQAQLPLAENTEQKFRDLYYHLYSNSNASRSERILGDLSKLILLAIAFEKGRLRSEIALFINGNGTANSLLMPGLARAFPSSVNESDRFSLDDNSLRRAFELVKEIDLLGSPSHTFGDAFQALMGPRLRGDRGQFFTPRSVVRSMVDILSPVDGSRVIDPACGTGGFLSAVLDHWQRNDLSGCVVGIDKDHDLSLLASALSAVHDRSANIQIHNANSLLLDGLRTIGIEQGSFDCVLTNPPFGSKIGIADKETLKQFELGHVWDKTKSGWCRTSVIRASQDPQILFLELCVRLLKFGGRLGIVLPEGIFGNTTAGYIWDYLRSQGAIEALIDCPRTTFQPSTDTKTNILFFKRERTPKTTRQCCVAVAYACGHDRRGRSIKANGKAVYDDFSAIAKDWRLPKEKREIWSSIELSDPYYLVPRYYDGRLSDDVRRDAEQLKSTVVSFGDLVRQGLLSIRKGHEVGSDNYGFGDVPFIRTSDIHNFEVSHDPTNCVSEDVYWEYKRQQDLKAGDILMVVDGRYKIGRCAILHEWTTRCVVQSHLRIISLTKKATFAPIALLYALSLPSVQREIRRLVFIQSTLGGLGSRINEIRIPDPRSSAKWGDSLFRFEKAIVERARCATILQSFSNEVEL